MKMTTTIKYFEHGGAMIAKDEDIGFSPFIGQIIENKFLKDNSCTGIFSVTKIDTFKDTKDIYICDIEVHETNSTFLENGENMERILKM